MFIQCFYFMINYSLIASFHWCLDPWIDCNSTSITQQLVDDEHTAVFSCSANGMPHSRLRFQWYYIDSNNTRHRKSESQFKSQGTTKTSIMKHDRSKMSGSHKIICEVTNTLIKNGSCIRSTTIDPLPPSYSKFI